MEQLLDVREKIYDFFHSNIDCQKYFFKGYNEERYAAYYTSMYLIADTGESLWNHRNKGFSEKPLEAYIEFWGVMQGLIIQQDSICELYWAVNDKKLNYSNLAAWMKIREIRNICAGHPAKKDRPTNEPLKRTFMGRFFGNYSSFHWEQWEKPISTPDAKTARDPVRNISHPEIELGKLIDEYSKEATTKLEEILQSMQKQWPTT